jgi:hypothetical protein
VGQVTTIVIDPNIRTSTNGTYAGLEDADGPLSIGQTVILREPESGIEGRGTVSKIDMNIDLVYLDVDWSSFHVV